VEDTVTARAHLAGPARYAVRITLERELIADVSPGGRAPYRRIFDASKLELSGREMSPPSRGFLFSVTLDGITFAVLAQILLAIVLSEMIGITPYTRDTSKVA